MTIFKWRKAFWLLLSTVLVPAALSVAVGVLILVFYKEKWDVASGVLVLCFAVFSVVGSLITVTLLRRSARLAELQTEFIANMSHDFRTPLTAIRMFVETLRQDRVNDPQERQRCLDLLARETARMEQLVNQVLTWRSVENTGGNYRLEPRDAEELVRAALEPLRLDQRISQRLELLVEPHLPRILADEESLCQALRNLVENALKYGRGESVVVNLRSDGLGVAISVRDQGPEIPRQEQKRIFKRFYRVSGTGKQGTGLGLAIARHTALAHGGSLDLRSARGVGNVFTLRLPLVVTGEALPREAPGDED